MSKVLQANIRERLSQKRMTIIELERRAGLKQTTVQNILSGRSKNPGINTVSALAKELGCAIEELILSPEENKNKKNGSLITDLPWNEEILTQAIQFVGRFITHHTLKVSLEKALICIYEIYTYTLKEDTNNTLDQKFAEWITERTLLRS